VFDAATPYLQQSIGDLGLLWTSAAIVLSTRPFGEGRAIASLLTETYGRHCGFVPGGGGKQRPHLQSGGLVNATWRARLPEQLGVLTLEPLRGLDVGILHNRLRLAALTAACSLLDTGLPEREPNGGLYQSTLQLLARLGDAAGDQDCIAAYALWERRLVAALGFGLPARKAADAGRSDTVYISVPKLDAEQNTGNAAEPVESVARQLHRTLSMLEEHVFSIARQSVPLARSRLTELIDRSQPCGGSAN
jgi:DNA repair protein RecO